jgi:rod shape-determining protein MreC
MGNIISAGGQDGFLSRNQTVIIDKGSHDGLVFGLAVVSSQGMIVGKIAEVKDDISIVNLITNPACKLAATILNSEKTMGVAEGEFGLVVKMNFIPQNTNITQSEIVITSGLEQNIPRGLVVGKITQVLRISNELWQNATIEPLVNLDNLIVLSVIVP